MGKERPAEFYDDMYSSTAGWRYKLSPHDTPWFPAWDWVLNRIDPSEWILDVGCGVGQFARLAWSRGHDRYHGVDFSPVAIERAKADEHLQYSGFTWEVRDLMEPDFFEGRDFSVLVMTETLEHIEQDKEFFRRIPPETRMLFSVPSYDDPSHARYFKTAGDVITRYAPLCQRIQVEEVARAHKPASIWVAECIV